MRGRRILEAAYTQRLLESKGVSSRRGRSIHGALRGERAEKVKLDIVMAGRLHSSMQRSSIIT
jgi:hypothetical protein